jgi:hypothetical protein
MVFFIIQIYLGYKKISKIFGFGPNLVEIGPFFRLFSLFSVGILYKHREHFLKGQ